MDTVLLRRDILQQIQEFGIISRIFRMIDSGDGPVAGVQGEELYTGHAACPILESLGGMQDRLGRIRRIGL